MLFPETPSLTPIRILSPAMGPAGRVMLVLLCTSCSSIGVNSSDLEQCSPQLSKRDGWAFDGYGFDMVFGLTIMYVIATLLYFAGCLASYCCQRTSMDDVATSLAHAPSATGAGSSFSSETSPEISQPGVADARGFHNSYIYTTEHGEKWHSVKSCKHLVNRRRVVCYGPCNTCVTAKVMGR